MTCILTFSCTPCPPAAASRDPGGSRRLLRMAHPCGRHFRIAKGQGWLAGLLDRSLVLCDRPPLNFVVEGLHSFQKPDHGHLLQACPLGSWCVPEYHRAVVPQYHSTEYCSVWLEPQSSLVCVRPSQKTKKQGGKKKRRCHRASPLR